MMYDLRIDGDGIVYKAGHAADSRGGDVSHSIYNAKLIINSIIERFKDSKVTLLLTSRDPAANFRTQVVDDYKANRSKKCNKCKSTNLEEMLEIQRIPNVEKPEESAIFRGFKCLSCSHYPIRDSKPVFYREIRQYLIDRMAAKVCQWGEADDWLGTDYTENTIIATNDKDPLMIPCLHWRIDAEIGIRATDPGCLELITKEAINGVKRHSVKGFGFAWFCAQMILGDTVDNIHKPKKGFGPTKVIPLFENCNSIRTYWDTVVGFYKDCGAEDRLILTGQLLWMARRKRQIFSLEVVEELINDDENSRQDISS